MSCVAANSVAPCGDQNQPTESRRNGGSDLQVSAPQMTRRRRTARLSEGTREPASPKVRAIIRPRNSAGTGEQAFPATQRAVPPHASVHMDGGGTHPRKHLPLWCTYDHPDQSGQRAGPKGRPEGAVETRPHEVATIRLGYRDSRRLKREGERPIAVRPRRCRVRRRVRRGRATTSRTPTWASSSARRSCSSTRFPSDSLS